MGLLLLIVLVILLLGGLPAWPYSRNWGYGPTGLLGLLVMILLGLLLMGRYRGGTMHSTPAFSLPGTA
jgi:hypothetical protein